MSTPLSSVAAPPLTFARPSHRWLIPPGDRFPFVVLFVLATGVGWFLTWGILQLPRGPLAPTAIAQPGLLSTFVIGLVSGLVVSAVQWLVLRRHLADWLWILAGATGYVLLMLTLEAWWGAFNQVLLLPAVAQGLAGWSPLMFASLSLMARTLLTAIAAIWLGLAQWLFLRQFARPCGGWIWVPPIAVLLSATVSALVERLSGLGIVLPLEVTVLAAGILGTTQAIALCGLARRGAHDGEGDRLSPLSTAPTLENYSQVQKLGQQLRARLQAAWAGEYQNPMPLSYWVGVTRQGAIALVQPTDAVALEHIDQIPLPALVMADQHQWNGVEPLARLAVSFLPAGQLKVQSDLGLPLWWIAVSMGVTVVAFSAIAAFGLGLLPPG